MLCIDTLGDSEMAQMEEWTNNSARDKMTHWAVRSLVGDKDIPLFDGEGP